MRIQYFSDLHLEFGPLPLPETEADLCVAAGDIHLRDAGIDWLAGFSMPVVYIAGNHEFYTGETGAVRTRLAQRCAEAGIHFLDDSVVEIQGVRFLGSTMWTDFNDGDEALMAHVRTSMNDYNQIHQGTELLTPEDTLLRNRQAQSWLREALGQAFDGPTVVVTHHAPSIRSWSGNYDDVYRPAYCNDFDSLIAQHDIALWIHGHIHQCADYQLHGTRVVCNPRGYHGYQNIPGFDPQRIVSLNE